MPLRTPQVIVETGRGQKFELRLGFANGKMLVSLINWMSQSAAVHIYRVGTGEIFYLYQLKGDMTPPFPSINAKPQILLGCYSFALNMACQAKIAERETTRNT
jgi:hypothetical protein